MARFTKALREQIVREFTARHNGQYNPALFLEGVGAKGVDHPAYEWFEWNDDRAAEQYRVEQARAFARDIRVAFTVEEIGRNKAVTIREVEAPLMISPLTGRRHGGGYVVLDPARPEDMAELCRQAACDLEAWLSRHQAALLYARGSSEAIERQIKLLNARSEGDREAA